MTEKTVSKYLLNLEKFFAHDNLVLQKAAKVFHELDQLEYDLGLIESDETTASKNSWWPIVSIIGGNSSAKSRFLNGFFGAEMQNSSIQTSNQKFTVLLQNNQSNMATLPGTALDVDHRFPFYQISRKLEQLLPGEGGKVNTYLELKTIPSDRLKGKLFIDAPNVSSAAAGPVISYLTQYIVDHSDLVLIFSDVFDTPSPLLDELSASIAASQDSNKFAFLIDAPGSSLSPSRSSELIGSWQSKLEAHGISSGQFLILGGQDNSFIPQPNKTDYSPVDQHLTNVANNRTYRVLQALERNVADVENIVVAEVRKGVTTWKDRSTMSTLLVLSFLIVLSLFAEINSGIVLATLVDPILGPISILVLVAVMTPIHLMFCKLHAKVVINQLNARQKELGLMENLANLFEKNLTFARMMLPLTEPNEWNKKTKTRLSHISAKIQELVQALNDSFSAYNGQLISGFPEIPGP